MTRFFQIQLRTLDVEAARSFYRAVLGDRALGIVKLHEQSVARGARPHWLGFLEVANVDRAAGTLAERGGTVLAKWVDPEGLEAAVVRDPGGAIVALARPPSGLRPAATEVAWYLLSTTDVERSKADYAEIAGFCFQDPVDLGTLGVFHPFAWEPGGAPVGSMSDLRPGVHPHWLFHLPVPDLDRALEAVRAGGGLALEPITLPTGERLAACDDPQGAAFAIWQSAPR